MWEAIPFIGSNSLTIPKSNLSERRLSKDCSARRRHSSNNSRVSHSAYSRSSGFDNVTRSESHERTQSCDSDLGLNSRVRNTPAATTSLTTTPEEPEDMILVMGTTGSGKSYFINRLARRNEVREGHKLRSETKHCQAVTISIGSNSVTVVDTPGFNDDAQDDGQTLNKITRFLTAQYKLRIRLKGVIFLHKINDNRIGGSGLRYLKIFREIWGDDALPSVALVSTMWSKVDLGEGLRRDVELREDIWKEMVLKGSYMFQYNGTPEMAETIVGQLMVKPEIVLKIQLELVDKQRPLDKTSAGHMVSSDLWQQLEDRRQGMRSLQDQLQVAEKANDRRKHQEIQRELAGQRNRHSQQLSDWQALREDIASETDQRIEEIEKEEKMSPKKKWSKVLSRVQKFVQILTPVVSITFAVLSFTGVL